MIKPDEYGIFPKLEQFGFDVASAALGYERKTIVYISGPMTGHDDYNRPAFARVARDLWDKGYIVRNPGDIRVPNDIRESYMRVDLAMLVGSDMMVLLPFWWKSAGARCEVLVAQEIGIPILEYATWEKPTRFVSTVDFLTQRQAEHDIAKEVEHDMRWRERARHEQRGTVSTDMG